TSSLQALVAPPKRFRPSEWHWPVSFPGWKSRSASGRFLQNRDSPSPCAFLLLPLHPRPRAAGGGFPKFSLPHRNDSDRSTPVLRLVRISESEAISACCATGRIIHCAAVVERNDAGKILQARSPDARLIGSQGLPICDLHVARQHEHRLACVQSSVAVQIDIEDRIPALDRLKHAYNGVAPYGS